MENYVGKRLDGRYEIIEIIGVGGMAVVYKAFDNIDNRIVAVKILKDEYLANEEFRRRFKNESKAIAVLSHPNIVKVYDVSYGDRLQYIVMEYVEGITLKEYIEQQKIVDPREAIYFVTQILRALQHAHDKGIVHRDIKPQNIMLIEDGTIKVTDFGIARFSRSDTKTMTDMAIGSVHYISPEQAKGSITDSKTDLYSVGVVLYEMLTGKLPFQSDNAVSVAIMQLQKDPVKPREINPSIPIGLEQIIMKAMQKNSTDRYQSASEMLVDIDEFKKNPNIKFNYSYFVDKQPTKYVPKQQPVPERKVVEAKKQPVAQNKKRKPVNNKKNKNKKKTIIALSIVLVLLIIAGVASFLILNKGHNRVDVPNLVGMNFTQEVLNNDDYSDFKFDCVEDTESNRDEGIITKQEPKVGKLDKGSTITLYVAKGTKEVEIPDVYGYEYASAVSLLKAKNFEVKVVKQASTDHTPGTVIKTSPARNKSVEEGITVKVYVATEGKSEPVDVPNLVGKTVDEAKGILEKAGLALDSSRTEYRSNAAPKGQIIGHEFIGEQVDPGTKIAVYVSTGVLPTETTTTAPSTESTTEPTSATESTTAPTTTEPSTTKPTTTYSTTEPTSRRETTLPPTTTEPPTTKPTTTEPPATKPTTPNTTVEEPIGEPELE